MKIDNLTYLLSGYFHQDWFGDASDPDEIIRSFVKRESLHRVLALRQEINELLLNNDELPNSFVSDNNCYYDPSSDGLTLRGWLQHIENMLS